MFSISRYLNNSAARTLSVPPRPLMAVCVVLAIIAIAKDQVKRRVQLLLASILVLPIICALSLFFWFVGIGTFIGSFLTRAYSTTSAIARPFDPTPLVSKQIPISLESLKSKRLVKPIWRMGPGFAKS